MKKKLRYTYVRLLRSEGAPREIAGGLALGVVVAMLPIMGAQMLVAVAVAEALRRLAGIRLSRIAAAAGVWLTNPLTAAPIYGLCWLVGRPLARLFVPDRFLAGEGVHLAWSDLGSAGPFAAEIMCSLTVGGLLFGIPLAAIAYRLAHRAVARYQARRTARKERLAARRLLAA